MISYTLKTNAQKQNTKNILVNEKTEISDEEITINSNSNTFNLEDDTSNSEMEDLSLEENIDNKEDQENEVDANNNHTENHNSFNDLTLNTSLSSKKFSLYKYTKILYLSKSFKDL